MTKAAEHFSLIDASIDKIHRAYEAVSLTARELVRMYMDRIEAFDKAGPAINSIIAVNPRALHDADSLDIEYKHSGRSGPLHGIPVILKDQVDAIGNAPRRWARFFSRTITLIETRSSSRS
jgi:Asp-tRNA(Asn)/Glu-tRNA(Gln) amidotransferase A subunit family amidase